MENPLELKQRGISKASNTLQGSKPMRMWPLERMRSKVVVIKFEIQFYSSL